MPVGAVAEIWLHKFVIGRRLKFDYRRSMNESRSSRAISADESGREAAEIVTTVSSRRSAVVRLSGKWGGIELCQLRIEVGLKFSRQMTTRHFGASYAA
jgi:hypothetical protein